MEKKVLIVSFSFEQEREAFQVLEDAGFTPVLLAEKERKGFTEQDFANYWNRLKEKPAGLLMGADISLGRLFASQAQGLEAISLNCAGADHLDLQALKEKGIAVAHVPRQNFGAVADFIWGLLLAVMRKIPEGNQMIRQGRWCEGVERGCAVSEKTIGIIGFGAIGQAVAKRASGFDMKVLVSSTSCKAELAKQYKVEYVSRDRLFRESDIIIPACPLVPETYHMIDETSIRKMKKEAVLINASRGGIIDTTALCQALKENRLGGAGLDVFEEEPLLASDLFDLKNVVLTPHMGGLADREIHRVAMQSAYHMVQLLRGEKTGTELTGRD